MIANGYTISGRLHPSVRVPASPSHEAREAADARTAPPPAAPLPPGPAAPAGGPAPSATAAADRQRLNFLKQQVQRWLVEVINPGAELERGGAQVRGMIDVYLEQVLVQEGVALTRADRSRLFESIV